VPQPRSYAVDYTTYRDQHAGLRRRPPWPCLSALPRAHCVVDHYSLFAKQKLDLVDAAKREGLLRGNATTFAHARALPGSLLCSPREFL